MTFEETCKAQTSQDQRLAEIQASFAPTIAELKTLRKTAQQSEPTWRKRFAMIESRRQAALRVGARLSSVESVIRQLAGDQYLPGPLGTLLPQLDEMIHRLEHFPKEFIEEPKVYLPWYNAPKNFKAVIGSIEDNLTAAEKLVQDGGDLHRLILHVKGQPENVAAVVSTEQPAAIHVRVEV